VGSERLTLESLNDKARHELEQAGVAGSVELPLGDAALWNTEQISPIPPQPHSAHTTQSRSGAVECDEQLVDEPLPSRISGLPHSARARHP
jgi:hypothetical protein